ncbi:hypothetical protein HAX54_004778 [Datura stramonium]|uniref:Uncharacterized protein n=1 Tax=Datura stramonium TaxID=4076 RepID=A0ABS8T8A0_DATST|nr:hypothetical protein [Datura stramonium]
MIDESARVSRSDARGTMKLHKATTITPGYIVNQIQEKRRTKLSFSAGKVKKEKAGSELPELVKGVSEADTGGGASETAMEDLK